MLKAWGWGAALLLLALAKMFAVFEGRKNIPKMFCMLMDAMCRPLTGLAAMFQSTGDYRHPNARKSRALGTGSSPATDCTVASRLIRLIASPHATMRKTVSSAEFHLQSCPDKNPDLQVFLQRTPTRG
jgi:hypothetical protein